MPFQHAFIVQIIVLVQILQAALDYCQQQVEESSDDVDCLLLSLALSKHNKRTHNRKWYINPRSSHWADMLFDSSLYFIECDFQRTFRMSRTSFERLHCLLRPSIERSTTRFRRPIPSNRRLAIFLYHITLGASYTVISNQFAVGRSTVSEIVATVSKAIVETLSKQYIRFPLREEALRNIDTWNRQSQIPGVIACIDGCHIPLRRPCESGSAYYNRKGHYSINIQGVCPVE